MQISTGGCEMPVGISQGRRRVGAEAGLRAFSAENDEQVGTNLQISSKRVPEGVGTAGTLFEARSNAQAQITPFNPPSAKLPSVNQNAGAGSREPSLRIRLPT